MSTNACDFLLVVWRCFFPSWCGWANGPGHRQGIAQFCAGCAFSVNFLCARQPDRPKHPQVKESFGAALVDVHGGSRKACRHEEKRRKKAGTKTRLTGGPFLFSFPFLFLPAIAPILSYVPSPFPLSSPSPFAFFFCLCVVDMCLYSLSLLSFLGFRGNRRWGLYSCMSG